jgi:HEAT repeat protein
MDPSEIESLFAGTLAEDDDDAWRALHSLQRTGGRAVFERAKAWCQSANSVKRSNGAAILGQLSSTSGAEELRDESYRAVGEMLKHEQESVVLDSVLTALGHLGNSEAVPSILRYADHHDSKVRFAAAFALGCFPNSASAIDALLALTSDSSASVRDWAVFGLGVLGEVDSHRIREALIRRLDDVDEDVREEAIVGLAKRRDDRVVPMICQILDNPEIISYRAEEAARFLLDLEKSADRTAEELRTALLRKFDG